MGASEASEKTSVTGTEYLGHVEKDQMLGFLEYQARKFGPYSEGTEESWIVLEHLSSMTLKQYDDYSDIRGYIYPTPRRNNLEMSKETSLALTQQEVKWMGHE